MDVRKRHKDFQAQFSCTSDPTQPIIFRHLGVGTESCDRGTQVKYDIMPKTLHKRHFRPLSRFLRKVEESISEQLELNLVCETEKGFEVEWKSLTEDAELFLALERAQFTELICADLQWNSNGSLLAGAFGRQDHDSFCFHKGGVCVWKTAKKQLLPEATLDLDTCVSAVAFHPRRSNFLAAAGCNGEIFLWDLSNAVSANLISDSGMKPKGGHTEDITCLTWVTSTDTTRNRVTLLSGGSDGRLIIWQTKTQSSSASQSEQSNIVPSKYTQVTNDSLLKNSFTTEAPFGETRVGVTAICNRWEDDRSVFLIGLDTGAIGSCSQALFSDINSVVVDSAVTLGYEPHNGPITAISKSNFSEKCFATVSTDGKVKVFRLNTTKPLIDTVAFQGKLTCCQWSPFCPFVLAVGTDTGHVLLFDFSNERYRFEPSKTVQVCPEAAVTALCFNRLNREHIGVACNTIIQLWIMPESLSNERTNEREEFVKFVNMDA